MQDPTCTDYSLLPSRPSGNSTKALFGSSNRLCFLNLHRCLDVFLGTSKEEWCILCPCVQSFKMGSWRWHTNQQHLPIIVQVKVNPGRVGRANNPPWSTLVIGLLGLTVIGWMIITLGFCLKRMLVLQLLQSNTILFARKNI